MRQKDLERLLQRVPRHPDPKPELEQVATPAPIAAEVLWRARGLGDVEGRRVLDLGCGTGVLAVGALLLGAEGAVGVDADAAALAVAARAAADLGVADRLELVAADVRAWEAPEPFDVAIQNPPFGAQERGADRPFLVAAVRSAPVVHSFHLTETGEFVIALARGLGAQMTHAWDYAYPIPHLFRHHTRAVQTVPVTVFRFVSE